MRWCTSARGAARFVGDDVTVGHCAVMEDCTIERYALIGSNATLLNGSTIGEGALIAAGSVVGTTRGDPRARRRSGCAGDVKKALEGEAARWIEISADEYVKLSRLYLAQSIGAVEDQPTIDLAPMPDGTSSRAIYALSARIARPRATARSGDPASVDHRAHRRLRAR